MFKFSLFLVLALVALTLAVDVIPHYSKYGYGVSSRYFKKAQGYGYGLGYDGYGGLGYGGLGYGVLRYGGLGYGGYGYGGLGYGGYGYGDLGFGGYGYGGLGY